MSTAAEWAAVSPYARDPREDVRTIGAFSLTNLSWAQQQQTMSHGPLLGGRRQWCGYSFELTGYGSLELCGPLAYRVILVHPDDVSALRQLHRLVQSGRLRPACYRRRPDASHMYVLDRAELARTRVDARDSWLFAAQDIARLCGTDDEVAQMAGPVLRHLLWSGRDRPGSEHFAAAITELHQATQDLAAERTRYLAALERRFCGDAASASPAEAPPLSAGQLAHADIDSIRLEAQVLAEVQREWEAAHLR